MSATDIIFSFLILIFSVILHEISHGYMALYLGDPTAKYQGRLTLNPLKHIDPIGSIVVPIITFLTAGVAFGWAKPVPFNPYNLRNRRWGEALVAVAGPAANIGIVIIFTILLRIVVYIPSIPRATLSILVLIVVINIALAFFNLIPVPPLDGSKILFAFFPQKPSWLAVRANIERYQFILLLLYVFLVWQYIAPLIYIIASWLTGVAF